MYGTFEDEEGIIHVMPVNEAEEPCAPHVFSQHCVCCPQLEMEDGQAILIHEQIH